jgi:hypothetical protein
MTSAKLKEIWSGFEARTTRALTNRAIDHIVTPERADWKAEHQGLLPHGFEAPAAAAFQALRSRIVEKGRKAEKRAGRAAGLESDTALPEVAYAPESDAARDLVRAVRSTDFRTRRPKFDYADAAPQKGKARAAKPSVDARTRARGKAGARKKFLGLF